MKDAHANYWQEAVSIAFEDAKISATLEQIGEVAESMQTASEMESQAFYTPSSRDHESFVVTELKAKIARLEREANEGRKHYLRYAERTARAFKGELFINNDGNPEWKR